MRRFKEAVAAVVALLREGEDLTPNEEDTIAAEIGRVRSELARLLETAPGTLRLAIE